MTEYKKHSVVLQDSILEAASELFIERGFEGARMSDIADKLGLVRTALYYYFKNKGAILEALTQGITHAAEQYASQIMKESSVAPEAALRNLVLQHARLILSRPLQFRIVERNESILPKKQRALAESSRRSILRTFSKVIQRGVESGQFRVVDANVAAFAIIGMCNWTAWWYRPGGRKSEDEVAECLVDLAMQSLKRTDGRQPKTMGVHGALGLLREDLDYLEMRIQKGSHQA